MRTVSDVRDSLTLCTTPRQRGQLTLPFRTTFSPHFPTYFNQLLPSSMYPYCSPVPTPELEALTHKVPLTIIFTN
jgi:hypothetical protein